MSDSAKTKSQLVEELGSLRARVDDLENGVAAPETPQDGLRQIAHLCESAFNAVPNLFMILDTEYRIVRVNPAMAERLGTTPDACIGQKCSTLLRGERCQVDGCPYTLLLQDGREHTAEIYEERLGGYFLVTVSPLRDADGHLTGCVHIAVDINDRKKAEQDLQTSETRFRAITENTTDLTIIVNPEGNYQYVSPSCRQIIGFEPDQILGKNRKEFVHPEDQPVVNEILLRATREPGKTFRVDHYRARHRDGHWVHLVGLVTGMLDVPGINGIVINCRNITERRHTDMALQESEERFRELFQNMSSGVAVYEAIDDGRDFIFKDFNQASERIECVNRKELIGRRVTEVFPGVREFGLLEVFHRVWKTGRPEHHPISMYKDDRITGWRDNYVYRLNSGEIVAIYDDVTLRKQTEEQLARYRDHLEELVDQRTRELDESREQLRQSERLVSIGTLAAGMAHEINNPIGTIMLAAQNVLEIRHRPDNDKLVEDCLRNIVDDADRCGQIIRNVVQFAKRQASLKQIVDVNGVIEQAVTLTRRHVEDRGGSVDLKLTPDLPPVKANPVEIEQVLVQLITNAAEAESGNLEIRIRTDQSPEGVRILIRDNGQGISSGHLKQVFDPFFTTRREQGHTGLGLSVVHGIIREHNGSIEVDSRPGRETTFTIHLPSMSGRTAEVVDGEVIDR